MKYKSITMEGTYYDLTNKLNNSEALQGFELISFYSYTTDTNICKTVAILKCSEPKETISIGRATPRLKFAEHYPKLNNNEFTTIRDHDKGIVVNDIVNIIAPEGRRFKAKCTLIENVKFNNICQRLLGDDLNIESSYTNNQKYLEAMQEYYPDLALDSLVWIYTLQKV